MPPALRPLPLSIGVMAMLVAVKVAALAQAFGPSLGPSLATVGASAGRTVMPSAIAAESKPQETATPPAPVHPATPASAPTTPPPQAAAVPPAEPAPSDAERKLLMDLRARREALEGREKAAESRAELLKAAERGLSDRLDQLTTLQARLESLDKTRRERDESNWHGLVKTYETMRPKDAALIFNDLDPAVLLQVLDRMKEAKAAPILAAMLPDRARAATAQLVQWRTRPGGGPQG